jgi:hypothetical protein
MGTPFPNNAFLHKNRHVHPFVYTGQLPNVVLTGRKTSKGITVCSPPFHTLWFVLLRPIKYGITSDKSKVFLFFWIFMWFFASTLGTVDTYTDLPIEKNIDYEWLIL